MCCSTKKVASSAMHETKLAIACLLVQSSASAVALQQGSVIATLTCVVTGEMVLDVWLEAAVAGPVLLVGSFDGDPFQTGALAFSLDALLGDPPAKLSSLNTLGPAFLPRSSMI